jgi:hypothetical protein
MFQSLLCSYTCLEKAATCCKSQPPIHSLISSCVRMSRKHTDVLQCAPNRSSRCSSTQLHPQACNTNLQDARDSRLLLDAPNVALQSAICVEPAQTQSAHLFERNKLSHCASRRHNTFATYAAAQDAAAAPSLSHSSTTTYVQRHITVGLASCACMRSLA